MSDTDRRTTTTTQRRATATLCGALALAGATFAPADAHAAFTAASFHCNTSRRYQIDWRGVDGNPYMEYWYLTLRANGTGTLERYRPQDGLSALFGVRHQVAKNAQDTIDGRRGPGFERHQTNDSSANRAVFWVDFNNTAANTSDDQRFDGYMTTDGKYLAGVTWQASVPTPFIADVGGCQ